MIHSSSNLPFECKAVKYLTSSIVAVAGNSSRGHLEILQIDNNDDGMQESFGGGFRNLSELEFPTSIITDAEVCGIPSQAKTFVATANIDFKTKQGYICLAAARLSNKDSCPLEVTSTMVASDPATTFTSLSFHIHQTHLAAASDLGSVMVFDILSEQKVSKMYYIIFCIGCYKSITTAIIKFVAVLLIVIIFIPFLLQVVAFPVDACGVNQVLYTRTGQLLTAGSSSASQLRLWDSRSGSSAIRAFAHPVGGSRVFTTYSSMTLHPSLPIVYCGTNDGDVIEWDLRYESGKQDCSAAVRSVCPHTGRVTSVAYHPSRDALLSSGVDGSVRESLLSTTNFKTEKILIEEPSPCSIACTDVHADYGTLVAASSTGSIWQIVL